MNYVVLTEKINYDFFFRSKDNGSLGMKVMCICYNNLNIYNEDTE